MDFHHECVAWTLETRTELLAIGGSATGGVGTRFTVPRPTPYLNEGQEGHAEEGSLAFPFGSGN